MKPQFQTKFGSAEDDGIENSYAACVASLLEFDLREVPDTDVTRWLLMNGVEIVSLGQFRDRVMLLARTLTIATGTVLGGIKHSLLRDSLGVIHDPHPGGLAEMGVENQDLLVVQDWSSLRRMFMGDEAARWAKRNALLERRIETMRRVMSGQHDYLLDIDKPS